MFKQHILVSIWLYLCTSLCLCICLCILKGVTESEISLFWSFQIFAISQQINEQTNLKKLKKKIKIPFKNLNELIYFQKKCWAEVTDMSGIKCWAKVPGRKKYFIHGHTCYLTFLSLTSFFISPISSH